MSISNLVNFLESNPSPSKGPDIEVGDSYGIRERDGRSYGILTKKDGSITEVDVTHQEKWYDQYFDLIKNEFPSCPFTISLDADLLIKLDEPFTDEKVIFVKDDRATDDNYYWDGISQSDRSKHNSNIKIE